MRFYIVIGVLLISLTLSAQEFKFSPKRTTFWDYETQQPVTILNDSTYLYGLDPQLKQIPDLDIDDSSLSRMAVAHLQGKTYLYDGAGGVVVEYSNHRFTRHDKSFTHKNQYFSIPFIHNGSIYLLGGYGLFTTKNILTRYDFKAREWFLVETSGDKPKFIIANLFQSIDDQLYFINLKERDKQYNTPLNYEIYTLDLTQLRFKKLGDIPDASPLYLSKENLLSYTINGLNDYQLLLTKTNQTAKLINFKANTLSEVKLLPKFHTGSQILHYNPEQQSYTIATTSSGDRKLYYKTINSQDLVQETLTTQALYKSQQEQTTKILSYTGVILVLLGLSVIGVKRYREFKKLKIRLASKSITYRGQLITNFTADELELLLFLAKHKGFIEFSDLMQQLDYQGSYDTLKKKRKILFDELLNKMRLHIGDQAEQLFIIEKSIEDKRYKVIKLNPKLIVLKS
ncbi:hypothetical protein SAMN05444278_11057 [Psychroflexus salarius]|uniref:Uncharacterized protein n=1 Tax=Psychroflexus salarius TaxID=1155689 RepID=A0A1M4XT76_9FLAO|nr:hypothetical protein [Psychroflexus salarius]SHE96804.1 hypothetical protein SAMN05444278_11057 [Psychroflexus salarius]